MNTFLLVYEFHYNSIEIDEIQLLVSFCVSQTAFQCNNQFCYKTDDFHFHFRTFYLTFIYILLKKPFRLDKFPFWFRYVYDTFILILSELDLSNLLIFINYIYPCIQFTLEVKEDNSLPCLDVLVSMHSDRFSTSGYRKSFSVPLPPRVLSNHRPKKKKCLFIFLFLGRYTFVLLLLL